MAIGGGGGGYFMKVALIYCEKNVSLCKYYHKIDTYTDTAIFYGDQTRISRISQIME